MKQPFDYWVFDDFQSDDLAHRLSKDFVHYYDKDWFVYDNPLEVKRSLNNWYDFPPDTYNFLLFLNSPKFLKNLEEITGIKGLQPDPGLHGAGWHIHGTGGKLNIHQDYSIHPKLKLQRKLNLIYYLSDVWKPKYGGHLEFWRGDEKNAVEKAVEVECRFNRAVLFDTTQNSWHGFPEPIKCPIGVYRKSIAMYYLIPPEADAPDRKRALYAPYKEQANDPAILKLIESRVKL